MKKGLVTGIRFDNIDENTKSTTSKSTFHGTAITANQLKPVKNDDGDEETQGIPLSAVYKNSTTLTVESLPQKYSHIVEFDLTGKVNIHIPLDCAVDIKLFDDRVNDLDLKEEREWLIQAAGYVFHEDSTEAIHWASYHAQKQRSRCTIGMFRNHFLSPIDPRLSPDFAFGANETTQKISSPNSIGKQCTTTVVNGVLPIFDAKSTDPSLVKHVIDRTSEIVQDLNRSQVLFITADQPIYAVCKRLQWYNPSTYGLKKVFFILGGLHLEHVMESVLGDYFNGSDVTDILRSAKVSSTTDASFLSGGNIMKTRFNYQVLAVVLYRQLQVAYRASDADEQFDTWTNKKCQDSCNFKYWHILYKRSLCSWLSWFFVFNHPNYQRFATTHFIDLHFVEKASPEMLKLLKEAVYSVNKSCRRFSSMSTYQNHEQVNKNLKGSGGISDLLNTTGSLERFLVAGPIVSQLINDFEGSDKVIDMDTLNHHSESKALQKRFSEDRDKLIEEFVQTGNPFVGYKDITSLKSKIVSPCSSDIYTIEELGNASLKNFVNEVFIDNKRSVFDPIK